MSRKRPFWLPEDARKARKNEVHENMVSYRAPNGKTRRYICSEKEVKFYKKVFEGTF
jgi:hypothetical protein